MKFMQLHRNAKDITNQKFGRLLTIGPLRIHDKRVLWLCLCDCGAETEVMATPLINGNTQSCGCLAKEINLKAKLIHGGCYNPEYKPWQAMIERCGREKATGYKNYGGRGIKVCDRWLSFANFLADMGPRPSMAHTIDRIDNDGNYEPGNCRWATKMAQGKNKRNNRWITAHGETLHLSEWSRRAGLNHQLIIERLKRGWTPERAVTERPRGRPE